jgi:hypothetical protein
MALTATMILLPALAVLTASPEQPESVSVIDGKVDERLVGGWAVEESSAVFVIQIVEDQMVIRGVDSSDGEAFQITNLKWDGTTFRGRFRMPSSNWTTHSALRFESAKSLWGAAWGDVPGIVEERWRKLPPPDDGPRSPSRWVQSPAERKRLERSRS